MYYGECENGQLVKSILRLLIVLDPLEQISADLNKAKEVFALIHDIVLE